MFNRIKEFRKRRQLDKAVDVMFDEYIRRAKEHTNDEDDAEWKQNASAALECLKLKLELAEQ